MLPFSHNRGIKYLAQRSLIKIVDFGTEMAGQDRAPIFIEHIGNLFRPKCSNDTDRTFTGALAPEGDRTAVENFQFKLTYRFEQHLLGGCSPSNALGDVRSSLKMLFERGKCLLGDSWHDLDQIAASGTDAQLFGIEVDTKRDG